MPANNHECPNCGYIWSKNEKNCKYCGTINPTFVTPPTTPTFFSQSTNNDMSTVQNKSNFSVGIFILLLIFCWPAAIVYLIIKNVK